ncbi:cyclic nucleotide-binding domain-containing protein [Desulfohalovibrio reitneri]|uniref:cyclic nucleotide-binding domain-containing protein n=1 Tax=Desulfohalovibrio reitneri TaxID=1307759 RepID=UPI0004A6A9CD|nr:cyclic nucleotide-binding domain-containing protein [Desulfohalovibrio reitneri]
MKSRIRHLSEVDVLRRVPTTEMVDLMQYMVRRKLPQGETVFSYGDTADSIFLIDSGKVEVLLPGEPRQVLSDGDSFGTRSFLSEDGRRQSTARTLTAIKAWEVLREDYLRLVERYPSIEQCLVDLNRKRERQCELRRQAQRAKEDLEEALEEVDDLPVHLREVDIEEARRKAGSGAALAIWLGIFLDGLPESAVIGASLLHASLSWALLAGVFLANFPEALSSSASMRQHNAPAFRIMAMWSSLTLTTALGALAGNLFLQEVSHTVYAAFEGMAAGAMLTMIAQTMLPEAYQQGGGLTGICTLLGFLAALAVRAAGG